MLHKADDITITVTEIVCVGMLRAITVTEIVCVGMLRVMSKQGDEVRVELVQH